MGTIAYNYTGTRVAFVVPDQCTSVTANLVGAGSISYDGTRTAGGGQIVGTFPVTPGETLWITVGGHGGPPNVAPASGTSPGGYNGGGPGAPGTSKRGGAGGGATDIRQGGTALSNRILVAAGAGGFTSSVAGNHSGGSGGADTGADGLGTTPGGGGTPSAGGHAGDGSSTAGSLGQGGAGWTSGAITTGGAGGGGGYYGGGGSRSGSGGGGSNFAGGSVTSVTSTQGTGATLPISVPLDGGASLTFNQPPNAPTLNSPPVNSSLDYHVAQDFVGVFADPDRFDTPSQGDFRWRVNGSSDPWNEVDDCAVFTTTTVGFAHVTIGTMTIALDTFAAAVGQQVEWQARFYDADGAYSPWSTSSTFYPVAAPADFVFSPAPTLTSAHPTIQGAIPGGALIYQAHVQVVNDVTGSPGSTIYVDNTFTPSSPVASLSVTLDSPSTAYVDGDSYHVLVKTASPSGVYQENWTDSGPLVAETVSPLQPSAVVTSLAPTGSVRVVITNPGSDPHTPNYNDVYRTDVASGEEIRIATGVAVNGTYTDYTPGFHTTYRYRVVAVTLDGDGVPHGTSSE